jgi:hypothetical protein
MIITINYYVLTAYLRFENFWSANRCWQLILIISENFFFILKLYTNQNTFVKKRFTSIYIIFLGVFPRLISSDISKWSLFYIWVTKTQKNFDKYFC